MSNGDLNRSDATKLQELVRQGERVLDAQLLLAEAHDRKTERLLALAAALLAGGGVVGLLVVRGEPVVLGRAALVSWSFGAVLSIGTVAAARAFYFLVDGYVGWQQRQDLVVGWEPARLIDAGLDHEVEVVQVFQATLASAPDWYGRNRQVLERASKSRVHAVRSLALSAISFAFGFLYLVALRLVSW